MIPTTPSAHLPAKDREVFSNAVGILDKCLEMVLNYRAQHPLLLESQLGIIQSLLPGLHYNVRQLASYLLTLCSPIDCQCFWTSCFLPLSSMPKMTMRQLQVLTVDVC